jgi:transcriptional regulator with XRE-family HTH domain
MSTTTVAGGPPVGTLLREWRNRRRRSQLELSVDVGVSTRHLSFVETGRSRPSPELVQALAENLEVPLRERNRLLLAAGYAPRYTERPLDDPSMHHVRSSLQRLLDAHQPYPGVVIDRRWDVVLANPAAMLLTEGLPPELLTPTVNVFRVCLHPDGLARRTLNFSDWAEYLVRQLHRTIRLSDDPRLVLLEEEIRSYPDVAALAPSTRTDGWDAEPPILVPFRFEHEGRELSLFTTLTTFGTPRDITLDELSVELFFPADEATEQLLRRPT